MNDISQIRNSLPILQVAQEYGLQIERKGNRFFIFCPWHTEKTASAELYPKENRGYSHCCKRRFDSIDLWAICENVSNDDAIKALAARVKTDRQQTKKRVIAEYNYTDSNGKLIFQSVRFEPKGFYQRRPDNRGGWINNLKGIELVPYRLTELKAAIDCGKTIFIVEGEKDVDALYKQGLIATCNSGGAKKWTSSHSDYFPEGTSIVILPDNDEPGHEHGQIVADQLHKRNCLVKVVSLPRLPSKGDISDWLASGHTKSELQQLVAQTELWCPQQSFEPQLTTHHFHFTELGTAERLLYENADNIRFCPELNIFLLWDGKRWRKDRDGGAKRLAIAMIKGLYDVKSAPDPEAQLKWAKCCESRSKIESIVELLKALPGVPISINELDQEKYLVNCKNGTIDLKTGNLMTPNKMHNITHLLPFEYRPYNANTDCQRWIQFLCEITNGNTDLMKYLWKLAGLCLSGDTSEHLLNIFYGMKGRNGKGIFIQVMQDILGDLQCVLPFATFEPKNAGAIPNDIAMMAGKRLVVAQESNEGKRLDEAVIKTLTGGDALTGRFLRAEFFQFKPTHKIILTTNNRPVIRETSNAIWARLRLIPFEVSFEGREDKHLDEKLQKELPEIFSWAVAGFAEWQREGLEPPECIKAACKEYRAGEDTVQNFVDECCYTNENCTVAAKDLYDSFTSWAAKNGEKPLSRRVFNDRIRQRNFKDYTSMGFLRFRGIGLVDFKHAAGS